MRYSLIHLNVPNSAIARFEKALLKAARYEM
jgi:hypothetical protein